MIINKKDVASLIAVMVLLCLIITSCGQSQQSQEAKIKKSDTVTIYTALPESELPTYFDAFTKTTGIKVRYVRLSAGEVLARVIAEKENPQASVWFGGSADNFIAAAKKDVLEKYTPTKYDVIPDKYKDKDGYWVPFYIGAIGFASNGDWLKETNNQPPYCWEDLLKPEYKGCISMAHPGTSGTSYTILASLVQMWGEDQAFDYLKKLHSNIMNYTKSGAAPCQQVALGEAKVGIAFSHDILKPKKEGYPITLTFPEEGTGYEIGAMAIIKGCPKEELENAKTFIDWAISKDAQDLFEKSGSCRLPINIQAVIPEDAVRIDQLKVVNYDFEWAAENRERLIEKFTTEVATQPK